MSKKTVYILRYDDELDHEQIGVFESKALMFKSLYTNVRDDLDVEIDDPEDVADVLDYYSYEIATIDTSLNKVYTLYEYNSNSFDFIAIYNSKPSSIDYHGIVESKINQKDLQGIYL